MRIALFDHDGHNHIGIVTDFGMLDFSRAYQAQQLIQNGEGKPSTNNRHDFTDARQSFQCRNVRVNFDVCL